MVVNNQMRGVRHQGNYRGILDSSKKGGKPGTNMANPPQLNPSNLMELKPAAWRNTSKRWGLHRESI